jgi:hypothetical protein
MNEHRSVRLNALLSNMTNSFSQTRDPRAGEEKGHEAKTPRKTRQRGTPCTRRELVPNDSSLTAATTTTTAAESNAHAAWQSDDVSASSTWTPTCCEVLGATSGYTRNPETYIRGPTNNEASLTQPAQSGSLSLLFSLLSGRFYILASKSPLFGFHALCWSRQARQLHLITVSGEHKDEWHGDEDERQQADEQIFLSFSLTHYDVYD